MILKSFILFSLIAIVFSDQLSHSTRKIMNEINPGNIQQNGHQLEEAQQPPKSNQESSLMYQSSGGVKFGGPFEGSFGPFGGIAAQPYPYPYPQGM